MRFAVGIFLLPWLALWAAPPVPYSGKVAIDGINYHGSAQFSFSLKDANGTTQWRNGADANESIRVFVVNGRYSVMLGGQGMNPLPPELFLQHDELYLSVSFDTGDGPRSLGPEQLITATPRALVAEVSKVAEVAKIAEVSKVAEVAKIAEKLSGDITPDMLSPEVRSKLDANQSAAPMGPITLSMLAPEVTAKLDANQSAAPTGPITRDMLPADVLADLNKSAPAITSITREMLPADVLADLNKSKSAITSITRDMLPSDVLADLNKSVTITRDMLPADVLADLNKTITRNMLPADVLADLNKSVTITRDMLPADVLADLNKSAPAVGPITLSMLDAEVTAKLDSNTSGTTTVNNPPAVGSLIAIPYGESAPAGYSLYQQGTPKNELVWEEKALVSLARKAYDGVEVIDDKIYFAGGSDGQGKDIAERYDPATNTWETLASMSVARDRMASTSLNGNFYAIGGLGLNSVEVYDPSSQSWSAGVPLPSVTHYARAITMGGKIYLIGGKNSSNQNINQVICFDPSTNQWSSKVSMPTARDGMWLQWYNDRIWAIGGHSGGNTDVVESYDPISDTWKTETSLSTKRNWAVGWVDKGKIFVGGGNDASSYLDSIEAYDSSTKQWAIVGNLPEKTSNAGAVVLNDQVYVIAGQTASGVFSNKVYAADLNASTAGVFDLYRKDGNASAGTPLVQAEVADGSVTASKIASKTIGKDQISDDILKYLKPEITAQPQGKIVYADSNLSFSVTAEGKYITYQWKKDGSDLAGETNATLSITDANATQHEGNYSVVVSNDFGSVESVVVEIFVDLAGPINGLVAWWKFDETSGTVAYDSSGNENDGSLFYGPSWANGKIGGALSFDGVDDYVSIPATSDLDLLNLNISAWINTSNYNQKGFIFEKTSNGTVNSQYNLFLEDNQNLYWRTLPNIGNYHDSTLTTNTLTSWNFVSASYDGETKKIFLNGNLSENNSFSGTIVRNPNGISLIGKHPPASSFPNGRYFFNGLIDDLRIYDRALSAEEVQALYNMGQ